MKGIRKVYMHMSFCILANNIRDYPEDYNTGECLNEKGEGVKRNKEVERVGVLKDIIVRKIS